MYHQGSGPLSGPLSEPLSCPPSGPGSTLTTPGLPSVSKAETNNPLDRVLPRDLLNTLLRLFFEYGFWLCPYPHRPTFERDIANHREEAPDQEEFTALVFALICFSLLAPKQLIPLTPSEIDELSKVCFDNLREFLKREYAELTSTRCEWAARGRDRAVADL